MELGNKIAWRCFAVFVAIGTIPTILIFLWTMFQLMYGGITGEFYSIDFSWERALVLWGGLTLTGWAFAGISYIIIAITE